MRLLLRQRSFEKGVTRLVVSKVKSLNHVLLLLDQMRLIESCSKSKQRKQSDRPDGLVVASNHRKNRSVDAPTSETLFPTRM